MPRRWKARSAVAGARNWKADSVGFAPDPKYVYPTAHIGDGTPGALRASNLHSGAGAPGVDLTVDILADGVTVDDVVGELAGGEDAVWPDEANVSTVETTWGPTGAEYAGALDLDLYRLITSGAPGGETPSTIAEAVLAEINGSASLITQPATIARAYRPMFDLKELADLHVTVVARSIMMEMATRSLTQSDIEIDVGVMKKLSDDLSGNDEMDAMMELVRDIVAFFDRRALAAAPTALWVRTENDPIYLPEHIDQHRQFTSVITLTYRVMH